MTKVHTKFVDVARWGMADRVEEVDFTFEDDKLTLTHKDGAPLLRARNERWERRVAPGESVDVALSRLVKQKRLAEVGEDTGLSGPARLLNPKIVAPY